MSKHPEQFTVEAWSANAIAFIEDQGLTREQSRLFDACLGAGMSFDEPDCMAWATRAVTADLVSA